MGFVVIFGLEISKFEIRGLDEGIADGIRRKRRCVSLLSTKLSMRFSCVLYGQRVCQISGRNSVVKACNGDGILTVVFCMPTAVVLKGLW